MTTFPVDSGYLIIYPFEKVLAAEITHSEIESLWHGAQHWRFSVRWKGSLVGDLVPSSSAVTFVPVLDLASTGHY